MDLCTFRFPQWSSAMRGCLLCEGPHSEAEEQHGEKGTTETKCCEKTTTLIPHPAVLPAGSGVKLSTARRGSGGNSCLVLVLFLGILLLCY